nr:hypothetical protein [uncultured Mediterraneibacter sp.]
MINSNKRKLCLSGWLMNNNQHAYNTPLKLQKFLLLYEAFSKVAGEVPDFSHLKGYKRGPVFSHVWGDYTKERNDFDAQADLVYIQNPSSINIARAQKSAFIVSTLSEKELSELTHKMNLWKAKEKRIMSGEYQVALSEEDFNENDCHLIKLLDLMYPIEIVDSSSIVHLNNNYFVFNKADAAKLTEENFDTLSILTETETLHNPVYVELDNEGRLLID